MTNKELQTPCYIIHKDILDEGIHLLKDALDRDWKNSCVGEVNKGIGLELELERLSCSVVSNSLRPHESQHARPPCPSPTPGVHSNSSPSSQ